MPKLCAVCGKVLETGLDEFGSHTAPVCRQCFFNPPDTEAEIKQEIEKQQEEIKDLTEANDEMASDIADNNYQIRKLLGKVEELEGKLVERVRQCNLIC